MITHLSSCITLLDIAAVLVRCCFYAWLFCYVIMLQQFCGYSVIFCVIFYRVSHYYT